MSEIIGGRGHKRGSCTIENCEKPHYAFGLCVPHYKRKRKWGDPLGGGIKWGEAKKFVEDALSSDTDDCIYFPYCKGKHGYGTININRVRVGTHVYVCEMKNGPKSNPKLEVLHSCGKGHLGCINPKHLSWGTRSQNMIDAVRHGTHVGFGAYKK